MTAERSWRSLVACMLAAGAALVAIRCTSTVSPSGTQPPPVTNTPPTIQSLTADAPRVEAGQNVALTAVVQDAETPVNQLTYTWSASPIGGTFTSTGAQATWRAPNMAATPNVYTLTLTVTERYTSGGVQRENNASSSVQVHYNDSIAEITTLSMDFLTDFATYSVSPEQCVRNFSDSCPGKAAELSDVEVNREKFQILDGTFSVTSVTLNGDRSMADVTAPCTFRDIVKATGVHEVVTGTCLLTSVYENWRWWLCDSNFEWQGTTTSSLRQRLRYAHP